MKKWIATALVLVNLATATAFAAENAVTIRVDGAQIETTEAAFIENDRTLVPLRALFEMTGADVLWDQEMKTVLVLQEKDGAQKVIALQIDEKTVLVDGEEKELDVPAKLVNDTSFVPLRFVMEELGYTVSWDQETKTVDIAFEAAQ